MLLDKSIDMNKIDPFATHSRFYGDAYFPYGLSRSGEFNRRQSELLECHGKAYEGLYQGLREPVNSEEQRFLAVCRGEVEAVSEHEKVWMLFLRKVESRVSVSAFGERYAHAPDTDGYDGSELNGSDQ